MDKWEMSNEQYEMELKMVCDRLDDFGGYEDSEEYYDALNSYQSLMS